MIWESCLWDEDIKHLISAVTKCLSFTGILSNKRIIYFIHSHCFSNVFMIIEGFLFIPPVLVSLIWKGFRWVFILRREPDVFNCLDPLWFYFFIFYKLSLSNFLFMDHFEYNIILIRILFISSSSYPSWLQPIFPFWWSPSVWLAPASEGTLPIRYLTDLFLF